jgi:hypothetical protein
MSAAVAERLKSKGIEFSLREDCAAAMLRIATDKSINGTYPERPHWCEVSLGKAEICHPRPLFGNSPPFTYTARIHRLQHG